MNTKTEPTYTRAYAEILDYVLGFCMTHIYEDSEGEYPRTTGGLKGFVSCGMLSNRSPRIGDLIRLNAIRNDFKWRLSWLVETRPAKGCGDTEYLLQSIVDGQLCWWSNVGIDYFHRQTLAQNPSWRWSDEQHAFCDRWFKACARHDPYHYRPVAPDFSSDGSATIGTRSRFDFDGHRATRGVPNWRKITLKAMADLYLGMVEEHKALPKPGSQVKP